MLNFDKEKEGLENLSDEELQTLADDFDDFDNSDNSDVEGDPQDDKDETQTTDDNNSDEDNDVDSVYGEEEDVNDDADNSDSVPEKNRFYELKRKLKKNQDKSAQEIQELKSTILELKESIGKAQKPKEETDSNMDQRIYEQLKRKNPNDDDEEILKRMEAGKLYAQEVRSAMQNSTGQISAQVSEQKAIGQLSQGNDQYSKDFKENTAEILKVYSLVDSKYKSKPEQALGILKQCVSNVMYNKRQSKDDFEKAVQTEIKQRLAKRKIASDGAPPSKGKGRRGISGSLSSDQREEMTEMSFDPKDSADVKVYKKMLKDKNAQEKAEGKPLSDLVSSF